MIPKNGKDAGLRISHTERLLTAAELTPDNINDPDIALGFDNLRYDCLKCHNEEHNGAKDCAPGLVRYRFDEQGELVPLA